MQFVRLGTYSAGFISLRAEFTSSRSGRFRVIFQTRTSALALSDEFPMWRTRGKARAGKRPSRLPYGCRYVPKSQARKIYYNMANRHFEKLSFVFLQLAMLL